MDFIKKHCNEMIALEPRTEALETPIEVVKEHTTDYYNRPYINTKIVTIDNNGG